MAVLLRARLCPSDASTETHSSRAETSRSISSIVSFDLFRTVDDVVLVFVSEGPEEELSPSVSTSVNGCSVAEDAVVTLSTFVDGAP